MLKQYGSLTERFILRNEIEVKDRATNLFSRMFHQVMYSGKLDMFWSERGNPILLFQVFEGHFVFKVKNLWSFNCGEQSRVLPF